MGRNARIISVRFTYSDDSSDEMDSSLSFFLRMLLTASQMMVVRSFRTRHSFHMDCSFCWSISSLWRLRLRVDHAA